MAAAVDSAAPQAPQAEREVDSERLDASQGRSGHLPVFGAFEDLGLTGRDVAMISEVTPPTVSKWRSGSARIPGEQLAFLTLVLAHLLDEMQNMVAWEGGIGAQDDGEGTRRLETARAQLAYQDVLNRELPATDVRHAAQRFRTWWASGAAKKLQEKRFQPVDSAEVLETLKNSKVTTS